MSGKNCRKIILQNTLRPQKIGLQKNISKNN